MQGSHLFLLEAHQLEEGGEAGFVGFSGCRRRLLVHLQHRAHHLDKSGRRLAQRHELRTRELEGEGSACPSGDDGLTAADEEEVEDEDLGFPFAD